MVRDFTRDMVFPWMVAAGYIQTQNIEKNARGDYVKVPTDFFRVIIGECEFEARVDVDRDWDHGVHVWQRYKCTNQKYIKFHNMDEQAFVVAIRDVERKITYENNN